MSCWGLPPPKMVPCNLFCNRVNNARFNVASVSTTLPIAVMTHVPPLAVTETYLSRSAAVGPTDGDDHLAGHPADSNFCDGHQSGVDVGISMCGTEFECLIALPFDGIDDKDSVCTAMHRTEQGCCAHPAQADYDNIVTGSNLSRSGR